MTPTVDLPKGMVLLDAGDWFRLELENIYVELAKTRSDEIETAVRMLLWKVDISRWQERLITHA